MTAIHPPSVQSRVLGLPVRTYRDPVQKRLTEIFDAVGKSDLYEVQTMVTHLARRRLFGLPLEVSDLTTACTWAAEDLRSRGLSADSEAVMHALNELTRLSRDPSDHPLANEPSPANPWTIVVPDDLLEEALARRPEVLCPNDQIMGVSEWRSALDSPGSRADIQDWLRAEQDLAALAPATLLAWPSGFYLRHWFENHAWLWFTPADEVRIPLSLVPSLAPRLWLSTARTPSGGWARSLNARMRRQVAAATKSSEPEVAISQEESIDHFSRVYSRDGSRAEHVEVWASGINSAGRPWRIRVPSYEAQIWDPDARDLKTIHCAPGTVIDEPMTLIHFQHGGPMEVNQKLASWANPLSDAVEVWRRAAGRAIGASGLETDSLRLGSVASGKQIRFHGLARNEALYRDLARFGDGEFRRLFPDFRRARALLGKWHAAQSQAGRQGVKNLETALATLGTDAPEITSLVRVIHCRKVEIASLSGADHHE